MKLTSSAFKEGERIPKVYTCEGSDLSPPLEWRDAPPGTKSFALVCADPDAPAGTWYHWAVFNIPAAQTRLTQGLPADAADVRQGVSDFHKIGYGGPCPPKGHGDHRYYFTLYALAVEDLELGSKPGCRAVERGAAAPAIAKAELMGTYSRD